MVEKVYGALGDNQNTIEWQISSLMKNEGFMDDGLHTKIGEALELGARDFYQEFKIENNDPKFQEYNKILESIKGISR